MANIKNKKPKPTFLTPLTNTTIFWVGHLGGFILDRWRVITLNSKTIILRTTQTGSGTVAYGFFS